MLIFSNPIFINGMIAIGITTLWIITCWVAYICGRHRGYKDCLKKIGAKKRSRRRPTREEDIRVLNPVEPRKRYAEAESVRIVATHAPRLKEEDVWLR